MTKERDVHALRKDKSAVVGAGDHCEIYMPLAGAVFTPLFCLWASEDSVSLEISIYVFVHSLKTQIRYRSTLEISNVRGALIKCVKSIC
jgi:hypothetical protein